MDDDKIVWIITVCVILVVILAFVIGLYVGKTFCVEMISEVYKEYINTSCFCTKGLN